jgi:hypothetical protein
MAFRFQEAGVGVDALAELSNRADMEKLVALTPIAADHVRKLAPKAKLVHLSWGADLHMFPRFAYQPDWCFLASHESRPTDAEVG